MASAAQPVASPKETTNFGRLCRLLVDVGCQLLKDVFNGIHPPAGLHGILTSPPVHPTLQSLKKKRILNPTQWQKLFPQIPSSVSSANFDISLLILLLKNICGLSPPASTGSWDVLPPTSDVSIEANIARLKFYRNNVYGHAGQASVDDQTFNMYWEDISNALLGLGAGDFYRAAINQLKTESIDPDMEEHYKELLNEWEKHDGRTKDKLGEMEGMNNHNIGSDLVKI